jgi:aryl-alcohol dehydrogenase-like predicted oxidoreductase
MKNFHAKIALGTVQFGQKYGISNRTGQTRFDEAAKILDLARSRQIHFLDTAPSYGSAEEILGQSNLSGFQIVSKFMPEESGGTLNQQLEKTLQKLNRTFLHGYLAHRPPSLIADPSQWTTLLKLKDEGKVKKIGYSVNHPDEIKQLLSLGMNPDVIQTPYNYFDTRYVPLLRDLKKHGCEVHVRSTYLQGLLLMAPETLSPFFASIVEPLKDLQRKHAKDLPATLLNNSLSQDFIDFVVLGVETASQLNDNLKDLGQSQTLAAFSGTVPEEILTPSLWPKG